MYKFLKLLLDLFECGIVGPSGSSVDFFYYLLYYRDNCHIVINLS